MNTKNKFGEWHVGGREKCTIYDKFNQRVASTFDGVLVAQRSDEECRQAARLIAAAPELLEALQAVVAVSDRATDEFDRARAAIAKATGASHVSQQ